MLAQIIQIMEGTSSHGTKKCKAFCTQFTGTSGNGIAVLIDVPVAEIRAVYLKVADAIAALRCRIVVLHPGGCGKNGTFPLVEIPAEEPGGIPP